MKKITNDHLLKELDDATKERLALDFSTKIKKESFSREIKGSLGQAIKKNPNRAKIITPPWYVRLGRRLKKFFTKF